MKYHFPKIFKLSDKPSSTVRFPVYILRNGKLYRTIFHPKGWSDHPVYKFEDEGKLYRTEYHELGFGLHPDYEFGRDRKIYRTKNHPDGKADMPDYEIQD